MSKQLLLPELAESVIEGEILKWLIQEGETVALEQPICEVMTDKVTVELPSPYAGVLEKQLAKEGEVVAVHAPIALISEPGAATGAGGGDAALAPVQTPVASAVQDAAPDGEEQDTSLFKVVEGGDALPLTALAGLRNAARPADTTPTDTAPAGAATGARADAGRVLAVPAARQLARELGVELTQVQGSGPNGRIRPLDVHRHAQRSAEPAQTPTAPAPAAQTPAAQTPTAPAPATQNARPAGLGIPPVTYRTPKGYEALERRVPLRGMRRAISTQMQASHLYTVRTLTVDEANLTALVETRARLNAALAPEGRKLSYLPFIFKAVVAALRKYPSLNTSLDEERGEIVQKDYYHLGMAVTTDDGLTVPVIRDADRRSLLDLGDAVTTLAGKARAKTLTPDDLTGSSFSVTNIGSIGALFSFPIINVPDAAILGVHSVVRRPIVAPDGSIVAADMMYLSLSFDHRLVDGAEAARFCKEVIRLLENPELLMAST